MEVHTVGNSAPRVDKAIREPELKKEYKESSLQISFYKYRAITKFKRNSIV